MTLGAEVKALDTVMTSPDIPLTGLFSTDPSERTTDKVEPTENDNPFESSTVISVVVAALIRPPLRSPDLTGSAISIICPGLTITPASIEVENVTTSRSTFSM